jgi:transcriptional regulator with XRE-family HTH domain
MKLLAANHIRAARAMLDWQREDLARESGVSLSTLANLETGKTEKANSKTYAAIEAACLKYGVLFADGGVVQRDIWTKRMTGDTYILDVFDDIYSDLVDKRGAEALFYDSDDRKNSHELTNRLRRIRQAGIKTRDMIEEGNTFMFAPVSEYRWIPKKFFRGFFKAIYGDKVFMDFGGHGLLIHNADIAAMERNQFLLLWSTLPELNVKSTADERF